MRNAEVNRVGTISDGGKKHIFVADGEHQFKIFGIFHFVESRKIFAVKNGAGFA